MVAQRLATILLVTRSQAGRKEVGCLVQSGHKMVAMWSQVVASHNVTKWAMWDQI